jgi:hypothetical protein
VRRWTLPAESTAVVDLFTEAGNEKPTVKYNFIRKDRAEAALEPVYGESDIPDRTLIIQDLDIIQSQNAWGGIWLTRNKHLVSTNETNPEFIFQTPQVRFSNPTTPLIVNDRRWDIATLGSPDGKPQKRGLDKHIEALFRTLLTPAATRPFVIRIGCGYAFALATGGNTDLLSNLPVLLSTQFPIPAQAAADSTSIGDLRKNLVEAISKWRGEFKPSTNKAMYNLKISIFSHQDNGGQYNSPNLPLLQLERLYLMLKDVKNDFRDFRKKGGVTH